MPKAAVMTMGARLKELRLKAGLSMKWLSREVGQPLSTLYCYERGVLAPTVSSLQALAKALGVGLSAFDGYAPPPDRRKIRRVKTKK